MSEEELGRSWNANAAAWTDAVREGRIASRRQATDAAVVAAALALAPGRVLDLGCGEGWLARRLAAEGAQVTGVDGSEELVRRAREAGGGEFRVVAYEDAAADPALLGGPYDLAVASFALLGREIGGVLAAVRQRLEPDGHLVVQTVHPWTVAAGDYRDGWRTEDFTAMGAGFEPMPWYFRTLESWAAELRTAGFVVVGLAEPRAATGEPLSLVVTARTG